MSYTPDTVAGALQITEKIFTEARHTLEGTRPDGPGQMALDGLYYALEALRKANEAVAASGEQGI